MESCESEKLHELRGLVEDVLPWLPSDQELQAHLQRANGNVHTALNSVVDRWEIEEENKDFAAQEDVHRHTDGDEGPLASLPHLPLQSSDQFLKQLAGSSSADLIPEGHFATSAVPIHDPSSSNGHHNGAAMEGEERARAESPILHQMFAQPQHHHMLSDEANFVEPALDLSLTASPANSLPGTPKKDFHLGSRGVFGLLDSPRKVDQTFAETAFWDLAMFGPEAPAIDSPPSPAKNLAAMCLMSCGPLPLMPTQHSPSTNGSTVTTNQQQHTTTDSFFASSHTPSSSSALVGPSAPPLTISPTTDARKRQLFPQEKTAKQQRSSSPPRLASIRSSGFPSSVSWRKPTSSVFSANHQPLFPPTTPAPSVSSLSSATPVPSLEAPLTLPDMITPPHPSSAKTTDTATSSLLTAPSVLSEEALQATAAKCAITAIVFTPGVVDPNLPPLTPSEQSRAGAIPAYKPLSPPSETRLANNVLLHTLPPAVPSVTGLSDAAFPLASSASQSLNGTSLTRQSSNAPPKRPAPSDIIVLDDDDDDGDLIQSAPSASSSSSPSSLSVTSSQQNPLSFLSPMQQIASSSSTLFPPDAKRVRSVSVPGSCPIPQRPLPPHLQQQLLQKQQQIRATGIARTAPSAPSSVSKAAASSSTQKQPVVVEVIDSDEEEKITPKPVLNGPPPEWPKVLGRVGAIISFKPLAKDACIRVKAQQQLKLVRELRSDGVISVYSNNDYIGRVEWLQARYLYPLLEAKKVTVRCYVVENKELRNATDVLLVTYFLGVTSAITIREQANVADASPIGQAIRQRIQKEQKAIVDMLAELFPRRVTARWAEGTGARDQPVLSPTEIASLYQNPLVDSDKLSQTEPSAGFTLPLYMHQKQALTWMLERENNPQILPHPLYIQLQTIDGTPFWFSRHSSELTFTCPQPASLPAGGILADEMGLGKTITTIALMVSNPPSPAWLTPPAAVPPTTSSSAALQPPPTLRNSKTTLIICPVSMMSVWKDEIQRATTDQLLRVDFFYGANRTREPGVFDNCDVIITSYSTIASEFKAACAADEAACADKLASVPIQPPQPPRTGNAKIDSAMQKAVKCRAQCRSLSSTSPLYARTFYRIVLDEAHMIRSKRTLSARAIFQLQCAKRWCLTGTPIHNTLEDIFSLMSFLKMPFFGTEPLWQILVQKPYAMKDPESLQRIHSVLQVLMLRRTKDEKRNGRAMIDLPPKHIEVVQLEFSPQEAQLYEQLAAESRRKLKDLIRAGNVLVNYANILELLLRMRQFCDHPLLLPNYDSTSNSFVSSCGPLSLTLTSQQQQQSQPNSNSNANNNAKCESVAAKKERVQKLMCVDLTDDSAITVVPLASSSSSTTPSIIEYSQSFSLPSSFTAVPPFSGSEKMEIASAAAVTPAPAACAKQKKEQQSDAPQKEESVECPLCGDLPDDVVSVLSCGHRFCHDCIAVSFVTGETSFQCPVCSEVCKVDQVKNIQLQNRNQVTLAGGWRVSTKLSALITELLKMPPTSKAVIFSQWTSMLNIVEVALEKNGFKFARLDGTMTQPKRSKALKDFETLPDVRVMLLSLRAGGLGLTLTCANYVFVLDPWWCPAPEQQAIDRVHRMGQRKEVFVKRFIIGGSVEQRILKLQEKKQLLARTTVGTKSERKNFQLEDLKMLFQL